MADPIQLPAHMRDATLEAAVRAAQSQVNPNAPAPIEHVLKNVEIQMVKELDPASGRWFVTLWMTRGDHRWVLQLDSFNAERIGKALQKAAEITPEEALQAAGGLRPENGKPE